MRQVLPSTGEQQQSVNGEFPDQLSRHHVTPATNRSSFDDCLVTAASLQHRQNKHQINCTLCAKNGTHDFCHNVIKYRSF